MTVRMLVAVGSLLVVAAGCDKARESYEKGFKESFKKSFVKSCVEGAAKRGETGGEISSKCECIASHLADRHTSYELMKLTAGQTPETKKIFDEAVDSCQ